jgi:epoxyqueuosine reductase QueG
LSASRGVDPRTPRALGLDPGLEEAGINAAGVLAAQRYDDLVPPAWHSPELLPGARAAVVLGCGGRAFGEAFGGSAEARAETHPVDRFTARVVERAATALGERGTPTRALFYWQRRDGRFADFVALGRACGLGGPGRLGVLIHPRYGPWISLRAVLLTTAPLATTPRSADFAPCRECPAPCAAACPGAAVGADGFDAAACLRTTRTHSACAQRCAARRACVIGREHAYAPDLERRYRRAVVAAASPRGRTRRTVPLT